MGDFPATIIVPGCSYSQCIRNYFKSFPHPALKTNVINSHPRGLLTKGDTPVSPVSVHRKRCLQLHFTFPTHLMCGAVTSGHWDSGDLPSATTAVPSSPWEGK